jgi:tetratricopeptide (TPR) repeat protein
MPLRKTKKPAKKVAIKPAAPKPAKAVTPMAAKNGRSVASAPSPPPRPAGTKAQYEAFEKAVQLLHKRNFREAKGLFEKAQQGPSREIATNAMTHVRMCERRLAAPLPEPKSAEEHYNYAIALINLRNLEPACRHLEIALKMDQRADHVHYAMGVCRALSGDASGAYDSLKRAIELQPRNRMVARQDSDLDGIAHQPGIGRLLYPEKDS